jgi:hypothetical protein
VDFGTCFQGFRNLKNPFLNFKNSFWILRPVSRKSEIKKSGILKTRLKNEKLFLKFKNGKKLLKTIKNLKK